MQDTLKKWEIGLKKRKINFAQLVVGISVSAVNLYLYDNKYNKKFLYNKKIYVLLNKWY